MVPFPNEVRQTHEQTGEKGRGGCFSSWKITRVFASCWLTPAQFCPSGCEMSHPKCGIWSLGSNYLFSGLKDEKPTRTVQKAHKHCVGLLIPMADGEQPALSARSVPVLSIPAAGGHPGDIVGGGLCSPCPRSMVTVPCPHSCPPPVFQMSCGNPSPHRRVCLP